jgi:3-isopropylmalate dehydratase small subunit
MEYSFSGRIWKLPDDVDTDTIIPGRYGVLPTAKEMSKHCLEPLRPELASTARPGDIFVAGKNFGCGSSREFAPECIKALGVNCIIAKSFARIFYRNGINNGMFLIECDDVYDECKEGDTLTVEVNKCIRVNGKEIAIKEMPENLFEIIKNGGLVEHYSKMNRQEG